MRKSTICTRKASSKLKVGLLVLSLVVLLELSLGLGTVFGHRPVYRSKHHHAQNNIILMIGDGMGVGHISATHLSLNSNQQLNLDQLPYSGLVTTHSLDNLVTDSAAAATALATGVKTKNGRISIGPNGRILDTILEYAHSLGLSTGLVTTTRITHATPAAFAAHVLDRAAENEIAPQLLASQVDVLLGGGRRYFLPKTHSESDRDDEHNLIEEAQALGYTYIEDREKLLTIAAEKVLGLFTVSHMNYDLDRNAILEPSLAEMTGVALQILSRNPRGFFLMIEGGRIDHAGHENNLSNVIGDLLAFDLAIGAVLNFTHLTSANRRTLLVITADHETGGLSVVSDPDDGEMDVLWSTNDHTGNMVPVYSAGTYANHFVGTLDNTQVGQHLSHFLVYSRKRIFSLKSMFLTILQPLFGLVYDDRTRNLPNSLISAISN